MRVFGSVHQAYRLIEHIDCMDLIATDFFAICGNPTRTLEPKRAIDNQCVLSLKDLFNDERYAGDEAMI